MMDILRDSFFGQTVRLVTGSRVFSYPEERDTSLWERYINHTKSGRMALRGTTASGEEEDSTNGEKHDDHDTTPPSPAPELPADGPGTAATRGHGSSPDVRNNGDRHVDSEKGKDVYIVDWYGPDDSEVRSIRCPPPLHLLAVQTLMMSARIHKTGQKPRSSL